MSSEEDTTYVVIGNLLLIAGMGSQLASAVAFYLLRNVQPVKRRFTVIHFLTWLGLLALNFNMYTGLVRVLETCWKAFAWRLFFPNPVIGYAIIACELYLTYDYIKISIKNSARLSEGELTEELMREAARKDMEAKESLDRKISLRRKLIYYGIFHAVQVTLAIASIAYGLSSGLDFESTCHTNFITADDILNALAIIVALIFCGWKIRHVQDSYWIKSECVLLGIDSIVFGVGGFILQFGNGTERIGTALLTVCFAAMAVISYAVPSIMAFMNWRRGDDGSRSSGTDSLSSDTDSTSQLIEKPVAAAGEFVYFAKDPKAHELYHGRFSDLAGEQIANYAAKCADRETGWSLMCLNEMCKLKNMQPGLRCAHALRFEQKYVVAGAYLELSYVEHETRTAISEKLKAVANADEDTDITQAGAAIANIFDAMQTEIEIHLQSFFRGFFRSEYYRTYVEQMHTRSTMGA